MRISDWSSDVCSSDLALLITFRITLLDRAIAGHLLDDPRHIVVSSSDLNHAVRKAAVVDLDRVQEVGRRLHLRDDVAHLLVEGFEEILEEIGRASCRERVCQYV